VNWSEEDQREHQFNEVLSSSLTLFLQGLFIELVAQHGDNFKRIASSMPNKVRHDVVS